MFTLHSKLESVQDADGKAKNKAYTKKYYYDGAGRLIKEKDTNETEFIYEYDELGNLLKTSVKDKNSNEVKKLSSSKYNLVGEEISKTDANNVETKYEYNEFGKVKKVTYASDGSIAAYYVIYQYDTLGQLAKTISSSGVVNVYGYDILGNVISQTESDLSGGNSITKAATYDANGNKTSETDGNGTKTTYTYNKINKLVSSIVYVTDSSGKKVKHETKYDYDKNGNLISETDWLGNRISYVYDSLNRVIEKKDQYNKTIEKLEYNDNGTQSKSTDALGNSIIYKYDGNKREIEKTDSVGTVVKTSYDYLGNVSSLTDGNGNVTEYTYDYLNRLINVKKINNGIEENTEYTYDLNGNMLTQTTGKVVVRYEYNVGNKVFKKISSIGTEIYKYNGNGTIETKTDKNGISTNYIYDIHGRVTEEKVGSITIKYTYDKNNNILTLTDSIGTTTRTYDELNSVTSKTVPKIGKIIYKYDVTGGITNLPEGAYAEVTVDKDNKEVIKIYDKAKRLIEVREGNNVTKYSYYDNGNLKKVALPNGYTEEYTYNKDNTLQMLTNKNSSKAVVEKYIYAYDKAKNIISKEDKKGTTSYEYDSLNRLTKVTEPRGKTIEYTYDKEGNRYTETETVGTTKTKSIYSYDSSNRLTGINQTINGVLSNTTAYTYDKNGNTLSKTVTSSSTGAKETTSYIYDVLNQLTKVTTSKGTINYAYNGEGYRIYKKSYDGTETRYLYEGDKVSAEFNIDRNNANNSIEKAKNIYGINLIARKTSNEDLYYLYNGHADVTMLLNKAGDIKATYYYDAFGEVLESTGNVENSIRYAGYQYDEETGLYYLNARMYDAGTARFLQEDTYTGDKKDPLSLNLYTYCHNNPLIYDDPTGHFAHILLGGLVGGALSVAATGITNLVTTGKLGSAKQYVGAFASGFVEGAVGTATLGIGSIAAKVAIDAAVSFGSNLVEQKITTGKVSLKKAAKETATGMAISGATGKVAKKFQNSKINQKLTKKLDDVTSSLKAKTKNITANIAKKTKEATQKAVNTVSNKAKNVANKTLKGSNSLKKGIKNYFSSKKKGAVRLDVLLPEKLFGEEIVENAEETITEQTLKKAQIQYDANDLDIASSISSNETISQLKTMFFSQGSEGVGNPELSLISEYANNDVFSKSVSFTAGEGGTGITYKVFQRNDIDWDMLRSKGAKKGRGLTNAEAAERYGLAPILDADGNVATLHHSQQHSVGPLFEASTRYHNISNAKRAPLHPYKGQLNPFNPMSEEVRKAFQKVDSIEYWKARGRDAMKGVK